MPAATGYFFITADISGTATAGNTINVNAVTTTNLTFSGGGPDQGGFNHCRRIQTISCAVNALPYTQLFNAATIPGCWSQQYVTGTDALQFVASSSNPTTVPEEGSDYVYWNSYGFTALDETRLVSSPILTTGTASVDVNFYWYAEKSAAYNSGNYLNEGVYVEYSTDGVTWTDPPSNFYARYDATASATGQWKLKTLTLPAGAGNQPTIYVGFKFHSEYGDNCSLDNVVIQATPAVNTATLANNGTQVASGFIAKGTTNNILHQFQITATNGGVTLTGLTCTTAGTYASADVTNLKVYYSATSAFSSTTCLSTLTTPGVAGAKTFPAFVSQTIASGATGYFFITTDISGAATSGNTINVNAIATTNLTITAGSTKTGSTTVGGTQTISCATNALTYTQLFNSATISGCWTQQYVTGTDNLVYVASSSYPTTAPEEGSDYVNWTSYNFTALDETRLVSAPIVTTGTASVDVNFYWYVEKSSSYNSGNYLNEGVYVQYSTDGTTWKGRPVIFTHVMMLRPPLLQGNGS